MKALILALLRGYKRWLSPLLPPGCRFEPTCSVYMAEAVQRFGAVQGVWLGLKRLGRCQPMFPGGFDPVPGRLPGAASDPEAGAALPARSDDAGHRASGPDPHGGGPATAPTSED